MVETIEKELGELDKGISALRIEYDRYFTGDFKTPPIAKRRQLELLLRYLRNVEVDKAGERFRLGSLLARYNSLTELWEKKQVAKDEGRLTIFGRPNPPADVPPPPQASTPRTSQASAGDASAPGSVQPKRVDFTPLFQRYVAARQGAGEDVARLKYEKFEELVRKQAEEIKRRTGAKRLVFEVQTVDGKVKLIGRPAPPKG